MGDILVNVGVTTSLLDASKLSVGQLLDVTVHRVLYTIQLALALFTSYQPPPFCWAGRSVKVRGNCARECVLCAHALRMVGPMENTYIDDSDLGSHCEWYAVEN